MVDYYGVELLPPREYRNTAVDMRAMVADVEKAVEEQGLKDVVAGVEMTGRYHSLVKRTLRKRWKVRMIHPFATSTMRRPANPGEKTDPVDLDAMERALRDGYGFEDKDLPPFHRRLRDISRAREDLVAARTAEKNKMLERLEELMPGYAGLFDDIWGADAPTILIESFATPEAVRLSTVEAIRTAVGARGGLMHWETAAMVRDWAAKAPDPEPESVEARRVILLDTLEGVRRLSGTIEKYERMMFELLVEDRSVLLVGARGVNVVSVASYAAELGPVGHYIAPKHISGRAGLYPSRSQSAETDRPDGPIVKARSARLRDALMELARGLMTHNEHFAGWALARRREGWDPLKAQVAIANRFARISYHVLAGDEPYRHPSGEGFEAVTPKLLGFAFSRGIGEEDVFTHMEKAARQFPPSALPMEIAALEDRKALCRKMTGRRPPKALVERIVQVLRSSTQTENVEGTTNVVNGTCID
jgi:transposase